MEALILETITVPAVPMTYMQIADDLEARIVAGEYPPGAQLPSYDDLAVIYSVSRRTAARAYSVLIERGVVVGSRGRGVFVRSDED